MTKIDESREAECRAAFEADFKLKYLSASNLLERCGLTGEYLHNWVHHRWLGFESAWSARNGHGGAVGDDSYDPDDRDLKLLQRAMAWCGIAGPESQEDLGFRWISYVRKVLHCVGNLETAAQPSDDSRRGDAIAKAIHYPDCWDTVCYDTLESALTEMFHWFKCTAEPKCQMPPGAAEKPEPEMVEGIRKAIEHEMDLCRHGSDLYTASKCAADRVAALYTHPAPRGADADRWEPKKDEMVNTPIGPGVFKGRSKLYWVVSFGVGRERRFSLDELSPHSESISGQGG